ncbi:hypothetical protein [Dehalogenimonas etheniformans]|uniref:Uncharacterized protein n=1 Tax=Dehalogenimonas etheniformans TaxID=1536648 RepID=A0A2P5P850_9CHLR|nr:hypothetical protein [Dehalogenimonas etheniformans]PPD58459.1 hypothetical protein JP09_004245 [Dehalogenimonas etheniformans]QNT75856.1 hypothetical protein HX448_03725 [Dehalogenimonas etheniformans]
MKDIIKEEFSNRAIIRGGQHYYNTSDALSVVKKARELGWKMIGIYAFRITDEITEPNDKESVDFAYESERVKN